jgi:hypothetical protein
MPTKTNSPKVQPHNLLMETIITLPEAARMLPPLRRGRPVTSSAVWKWASKGLRLSDGTRLKLEVLKIGSRWLTSKEAVFRLCQRQTADRLK